MSQIEQLRFLSPEQVFAAREQFGSPVYVYEERLLRERAKAALAFPDPFGLTVRYAIKACPNSAVLRLFDREGLHFDASSGFEAKRAIRAGIDPTKISLSAQQMPADVLELVTAGVHFVATSLDQIDRWGSQQPGSPISLRWNPGIGSGGTNRTNVGGPNASFGIWHEQFDAACKRLAHYQLTCDRFHTHIGSGTDPNVWGDAALRTLALVERMESVESMDLGGGFKVARMQEEVATDLQATGQSVRNALLDFAERTGRMIRLEIEPGAFLVANAGALIATVTDVVSTGTQGHCFLRTDTGLTEILRPALYGAQHPIVVVPPDGRERKTSDYVVVGHCCESGDILSPAPGDPEMIALRRLHSAQPGDPIVIESAGAYCSAMTALNYNSFPQAPEVMLQSDGKFRLIRRRQTMDEMLQLETESTP